tara:strand:- start:417 stop:872 length:456 start_codon:yes stop_codon:yes gene_type:complete
MKNNNPQLNPNVKPLYDELSVRFDASIGKYINDSGSSFNNAKDAIKHNDDIYKFCLGFGSGQPKTKTERLKKSLAFGKKQFNKAKGMQRHAAFIKAEDKAKESAPVVDTDLFYNEIAKIREGLEEMKTYKPEPKPRKSTGINTILGVYDDQ